MISEETKPQPNQVLSSLNPSSNRKYFEKLIKSIWPREVDQKRARVLV